MTPLLLATRSTHKAGEIQRILGLPLIGLQELGIAESPEEDALENADTFLGNARAKALYFTRRTGRITIADDSGLEVAALQQRPGVRTRRFAMDAGAADLSGTALDQANNALLLDCLKNTPPEQRAARYVCAAVLSTPDQQIFAALGTCTGEIATQPRGQGGFGYDPLFLLPDLNVTFAELTPEQKNMRSHRARAFRALATLF